MKESIGKIPLCSSKKCTFKCCDFEKMAHILLYPGELEDAKKQGWMTAHLEVLEENYHGGVRVRCRAKDTTICDYGYKPLDCVSYPFFPIVPKESTDNACHRVIMLGKGSGCPILRHEIPNHEVFIQDLWKKRIEKKPIIWAWLKAVSFTSSDLFDHEEYEL